MASLWEVFVLGAVSAVLAGAARSFIEGAIETLFVALLRCVGIQCDRFDCSCNSERMVVQRRLVDNGIRALKPSVVRDELGYGFLYSFRPLMVGWCAPDRASGSDTDRNVTMYWSAATRAVYLRPDRAPVAAAKAGDGYDEEQELPEITITYLTISKYGNDWCAVDIIAPMLMWPRLADTLDTIYGEVGTAGGGVLLTGPSGVGKSCIAQHLALRLKQDGRKPTLLVGINLLSDITFEWFVNRFGMSHSSPLILVLEEYDVAVDRITSGEPIAVTKSGRHLAGNKTDLTVLLDKIQHCGNMIVIATSNRPPAWWQEERVAFSVRGGRFDVHVDMPAPDVVELNIACATECERQGIPADAVPRLARAPPLPDLARALRLAAGDAKAMQKRLAAWL